jgi:hypothetical protein
VERESRLKTPEFTPFGKAAIGQRAMAALPNLDVPKKDFYIMLD